ncbi:MAG: hypothetical protein WDW36_007954 [Sanguina aurantia]
MRPDRRRQSHLAMTSLPNIVGMHGLAQPVPAQRTLGSREHAAWLIAAAAAAAAAAAELAGLGIRRHETRAAPEPRVWDPSGLPRALTVQQLLAINGPVDRRYGGQRRHGIGQVPLQPIHPGWHALGVTAHREHGLSASQQSRQ